MNKLKDIPINPFQLNRLLNEEQLKGYNYLLDNGVYCASCGGTCAEGVKVNEIILNSVNDILVRGTCKVCGGKVARVMEFGQDREYFEQANAFQSSLEDS
jgi:hypothetical protein